MVTELGLGRSADPEDYDNKYQKTERSQRKKFNVDMRNVTFNQVDDVVLAGGFEKVNLDNITATGKTNFFTLMEGYPVIEMVGVRNMNTVC